ncbi:Acid membrane antigen A [hydrothermal vent metagenome]|uniref:Acid membrane antigen A n=1 Tax=hydrothermal vent metagenome TaxID=652676 RepID=A0A1W1CZX2_9ZZZZ
MRKNEYITAVLFAFAILGAYSIYKPFLLSFVVALLLTMATANLHYKLRDKISSSSISSLILSFFLLIILFVPISYIATIGIHYMVNIDKEIISKVLSKIITQLDKIPMLKDSIDYNIESEKVLGLLGTLKDAGTTGVEFVKNTFFVTLFYYFINLYSEQFFILIQALFPLSDRKGTKILTEISSTMEVVFYSIVVTAIFEGILFGLISSYYGFNGLLLGTIYGFASLIPIIGGAVVWMPVSLYAWSYHDDNTAIVIAIYSIVVISIIADTFIKPMIIKYIKEDILHSSIKINEIIIFFSILAGMSSYGFWGMILGPAITAFLIAITRLYIDLYGKESP